MTYYKSDRGILYHGDCLEIMKKMPDNYFSGIVTDPPYGLEFMGKHWDKGVPGVAYWEEVLRVCKPGSFLFSFGGTRMFHRLTCAIEDAGWEIRDCMMWLYGTGFPKSHNISKAIDKAKGKKRKVIGIITEGRAATPRQDIRGGKMHAGSDGDVRGYLGNEITAPATPEAELWDGYGTALKPAWEPIIVAMKPTEGTFVQNALKYGVAGLNIDISRIPLAKSGEDPRLDGKGSWSTDKMAKNVYQGGWDGKEIKSSESGRWPTNVILTHHPECEEIGTKIINEGKEDKEGSKKGGIWSGESHGPAGTVYGEEVIESWNCHPDCPVRILDEQSGIGKSPSGQANRKKDMGQTWNPKSCGLRSSPPSNVGFGDTGGASRFFYCAKASKSERNKGLESLTPKRVSDGRTTINDTAYQRDRTLRQNTHPTVKPIKLMQYLCSIITMPEGGIILDPFIGSGSTAIACESLNQKWVGIELEKENCEISKLRIEAEIKDDKKINNFFT